MDGLGTSETERGMIDSGAKSGSSRSGGGWVRSRSSSDFRTWVTTGGSSGGVREDREVLCTCLDVRACEAANWSFRTDTSVFESAKSVRVRSRTSCDLSYLEAHPSASDIPLRGGLYRGAHAQAKSSLRALEHT